MAKTAAAFTSLTTLATRRRINVPAFLVRSSSSSSSSPLPPLHLQLQPSPVEALHNVFDDDKENKMRVFVKRDDKLDLLGAGIYGNKARKLWGLAASSSSSFSSFPSACVSWGGRQSNALLALAGLVCGVHKKKFVYYTKSIPKWLKAQPSGNYKRALELGVDFRELPAAEYRALFGTEGDRDGKEGGGKGATAVVSLEDLPVSQEEGFSAEEGEDVLLVPQGAAFEGAEEGLRLLAEEIADWWRLEENRMERGTEREASLAVVLPAGTGTTAFYMAKHLKRLRAVGEGKKREEIVVYAVPCVGDGDYLKAQMTRLSSSSLSGEGGREERSTEGENDVFPRILPGSIPHVFGKPEQALLDIWHEVKAKHGLELDLLYGPHAWRVMLENFNVLAAKHECVLYVHTGGLEGLESQLGRYRHLGMLVWITNE